MRLAKFITDSSKRIISEWEEFARVHLPAASKMDLDQRRDHVEGMLKTIAHDLDMPQTKRAQASKSTGKDDAQVGSDTSANAHGTDRAATGFSPVDVLSEFRALRASVLRLWSEAQNQFSRENLEEVTRFNESIDQLLAESMTRYAHDVDRSKDLFLGVLGHDLRNPLGAIIMSATVMMTKEGPDWPQLKTATRIINAGTRMDGLIADLVDFTRTRLGSGIPIVRARMDLETICRQTVDELTAFHPRCVVKFKASGELLGKWDSGRIGQALSNLCGNAFQHGCDDTPIDVVLRGEADQVVLTVHNEGRRIPKSQLHDIFNPFSQLEPGSTKPKDARSIGLGLFIVQAIVTAHKGMIEVESTERGTTFTVSLPRSVPTEPRRSKSGTGIN
ncbi:MAG: sensor histidine kinase [Myxococcota bacterium]|nr:sensor histidine kinase [Deltaproteobacteria bacterium]MDQ3338338.1 sensor histidine kinase [Myxococcota bacterium]